MLNIVDYNIKNALVGVSNDIFTSFKYDNLEEEPKLIPEPIEIMEVDNIEVLPYVKKLDYITHLDKYFNYRSKTEGTKYYVLDKIKSINYSFYKIEGTVTDRKEDKVSIELDRNFNIVDTKCTCRRHFCKHAYALVLKYTDEYIHNNKAIYYMFKTKYLLTQFRNLYNLVLENVDITDDIEQRIKCYDKLINNYSEKEPTEYNYNEIYNHYDNLKSILYKINKDLYSDILLNVEFIDYDIISKFYKELVNEEYIEDVLLDTIDEV